MAKNAVRGSRIWNRIRLNLGGWPIHSDCDQSDYEGRVVHPTRGAPAPLQSTKTADPSQTSPACAGEQNQIVLEVSATQRVAHLGKGGEKSVRVRNVESMFSVSLPFSSDFSLTLFHSGSSWKDFQLAAASSRLGCWRM